MKTIYNLIGKRQDQFFPAYLPLGVDLMEVVYDSWFAAAESVRQELFAQGLVASADYVKQLISNQFDYCKRYG
jgi:hypothetical protein